MISGEGVLCFLALAAEPCQGKRKNEIYAASPSRPDATCWMRKLVWQNPEPDSDNGDGAKALQDDDAHAKTESLDQWRKKQVARLAKESAEQLESFRAARKAELAKEAQDNKPGGPDEKPGNITDTPETKEAELERLKKEAADQLETSNKAELERLKREAADELEASKKAELDRLKKEAAEQLEASKKAELDRLKQEAADELEKAKKAELDRLKKEAADELETAKKAELDRLKMEASCELEASKKAELERLQKEAADKLESEKKDGADKDTDEKKGSTPAMFKRSAASPEPKKDSKRKKPTMPA